MEGESLDRVQSRLNVCHVEGHRVPSVCRANGNGDGSVGSEAVLVRSVEP